MLRVAARRLRRQVSVHAPTTCHWLTKLTARTIIQMASAAAPAAAAGGTSRYSCSTSSVSDVQVVTIVDTEGGVQASIAPSRGAELCSLQVKVKDAWLEVLDRANDFSKPTTEWCGRGQNLWPAVGRSYIDETADDGSDGFKYAHGGSSYSIPLHGFIKSEIFTCTTATSDALGAVATCKLSSKDLSKAARDCYPFDFAMTMAWSVLNGALSLRVKVDANGSTVVPFSIGNHIAFRFPFLPDAGCKFDDGVYRGSVTQQLGLSSRGVLDGTSSERPELGTDGMTLAKPENRDTVLGGVADSDDCYLELVQPGAMAMRVTHVCPDLPAALKPHRYFVLWGENDYFCPEPWLGAPNSLNNGKGLVIVEAGGSFQWGMDVTMHDDHAKTAAAAAAAVTK